MKNAKTGRPKKITDAHKVILKEIVEANQFGTLDDITTEFRTRSRVSAHSATIRKALRDVGIVQIRGSIKLKPRASDTESRYGYTEEHRHVAAEQDYPSSLTDAEWALVSDLFESDVGRGVPPKYARREILNACSYIVRTGCAWRLLPNDFPPWQNVYRTFRRWSEANKFEHMHDRLRNQWREREERAPAPTAAVIDAQSSRTSPQGGEKGYDAGKKVKGRKRNIVVDTLGLLLAVTVTAASVQDRDAAHDAMASAVEKYPTLEKLYVDGGYAGKCAKMIAEQHQIDVEVVRHPANKNVGCWHNTMQSDLFPVEIEADSSGFVVLPKRWVVERTFGWGERSRRLIMHHDRRIDVSSAWVWLAHARLLARRLTHTA